MKISTIVENITKGEISKLIVEIKGSVNKKISINKVISKETEFILESRRNIFLPNDNEIKEITEKVVSKNILIKLMYKKIALNNLYVQSNFFII